VGEILLGYADAQPLLADAVRHAEIDDTSQLGCRMKVTSEH
jgi:hypothetical protein